MTAPGPARPPFEKGNTLSLRHGAFAEVALRPRAAELAEQLLASLPEAVRHDRFRAMCSLVASALARHERAVLAAEQETDPDRAARLDVEASRWWKHCHAGLKELALSPAALAALGVDVAAAENALRRAELLEEGRRVREGAAGRQKPNDGLTGGVS